MSAEDLIGHNDGTVERRDAGGIPVAMRGIGANVAEMYSRYVQADLNYSPFILTKHSTLVLVRYADFCHSQQSSKDTTSKVMFLSPLSVRTVKPVPEDDRSGFLDSKPQTILDIR